MPTRKPKERSQPKPSTAAAVVTSRPDDRGLEAEPDSLAVVGERLRQLALGLTVALITARVYWVSEPVLQLDAGTGMTWVAAILVVAGIALLSGLIGGTFRFRLAWADLGVVALMTIVGLSASGAQDRRPAINLAWEWGGLGFAYLLLRNLPRTPWESKALAGALAATAVAVATYGVYQGGVELPELQRNYKAHREQALAANGITPGTSAATLYDNRVLSKEPFSTFALPNSLAGFLVGPLVLILGACWNVMTRPGIKNDLGARLGAIGTASPLVLIVLVCLMMTKSRSAWVGTAAALAVLVVGRWRLVPPRTLLISGILGLALVGTLIAGGFATKQLDTAVLTQTGKSLGYRWQYWTGAWKIITSSPRVFLHGVGPGNFVSAYVKVKAPEAGEEVFDPHEAFLEVWATAGLFALIAFCAAILGGLWNLLRSKENAETESQATTLRNATDPPRNPVWLFLWGGIGGWIGVVLLGELNPFVGDLFSRWLILGGAWLLAVIAGFGLWRRPEALTSGVVGAAMIGLLVNLTAAGGIGIPAVAGCLWGLLALGLNLAEGRSCSKVREVGRLGAFVPASVWAACFGIFVGAVGPYFSTQAEINQAEEALRASPPALERAERAYQRASLIDLYSSRPWLALAALDYQVWNSKGAKGTDLRWKKILVNMIKGVEAPRATNSWSKHRERARMASLLVKLLGGSVSPVETTILRGKVVEASRSASLLYPTNASLRAWLSEASADIGMTADALKEGKEALRLDKLTPHLDKKLDPQIKLWLQNKIPEWEVAVKKLEAGS